MVRRQAFDKIIELSKQFKAVAIIGPRQSGKTTLAKMCFPEKTYVSLENPSIREFALNDPEGFLSQHADGAIFDEIQRAPDLLSYLQQNLDEDQRKGKYILTGSNNFLLLEKITQSLAGRVAYLELLPFSVQEVFSIRGGMRNIDDLLFHGSYPPVHADGISPQNWFPAYVRTYVERDVRQIRNIENLLLFEKILALCAGRVGQLVNYSSLAVEAGVDHKTVQSWLGILQASYIIHLLPPFYKNFNKRIVKSPKLYFHDTGLACYLLRISAAVQLYQHPSRGSLFENFIVNELMKARFNAGQRSNLYFWRDSSGHEVDVVIDEGRRLIPIEIKSGQTVTSDYFKNLDFWESMTGDRRGVVFYGGDKEQIRSTGFKVKSWRSISSGY